MKGQITLDEWMSVTKPKAVPIWKRYPANCRGICPNCGTEVYYDATYGQRISEDNWNPVDGEYRGRKICPKCKTEFADDARFPYDDYESYPTLSGIDDKPIKDVKPSAPTCQFSGHECNKKELWKIADSLDDVQCPHVCCRLCMTKGCGVRCNGSEEPKEIRRWQRFCKTKPEKSGRYEIMDIHGTRGHAWFEKGLGGFDHVTGYPIEAWREEKST